MVKAMSENEKKLGDAVDSLTLPLLRNGPLPLPLAGSSREADRGRGEGRPASAKKVPETGGPEGPEPTRYGDWERKGRCIDF